MEISQKFVAFSEYMNFIFSLTYLGNTPIKLGPRPLKSPGIPSLTNICFKHWPTPIDVGPVGGTVVDDHLTEVDEIFEAAKYFIWQPSILQIEI